MIKQLSFLLVAVLLLSAFQPKPEKDTEVIFYKGTFDNLLRESRKTDKPIILDFWASWCGPCKKMDAETFKNQDLASYVNANFLVYRVNIDTFEGMEIVEKYDVEVFPTLIITDKRGNKKELLKGFYPPNYLNTELRKIQAEHNLYAQLINSNVAYR